MVTSEIELLGLSELKALQVAFDKWVDGEKERLSHHFANIALETWLSAELAYLINTQTVPDLADWRAVLEYQKVDLTLLPKSAQLPEECPDRCFNIELKIADTSYWNPAWNGVIHDLRGFKNRASQKQPAKIAGVFVHHATGDATHRERKQTRKKREDMWVSVPGELQCFQPVDGQEIEVYIAGECHELEWRQPVPGRWRTYAAKCKMVWVAYPGNWPR